MAGIEKFEDIEAWRGARALVSAIYQVTDQGPFARDHALRDQVRRAAVSIMSNIAEGFERGSDKEFRKSLFVAMASAAEVRSLLYVAVDLDYLAPEQHERLASQATRLSRQIAGFIRYLDTSL